MDDFTVKDMKQFLEELDAGIATALSKSNITISCKKGCAGCCHMVTLCTITEGVYISGELLHRMIGFEFEAFQHAAEDIFVAAQQMDYEGMNHRNYMDKKVPCVFLTPDKTCSIYSSRPVACRAHVVISPPENCEPDAKHPTTQMIDLRYFEAVMWKIDGEVRDKGTPSMGPLPLMVLWGMRYILEDVPDFYPERVKKLELMKKIISGLPTPDQWMQKHAITLAAEGVYTKEGPLPKVPAT